MVHDLKVRGCKKCNTTYPHWFFRKCSNKSGYRTTCKKCEALYVKNNYEFLKEAKNERYKKLTKYSSLFKSISLFRNRCKGFINNKTCRNKEIEKMLGCSYDEARKHIELKFKDGMNWGNYGSVWEIDHIEPIGCANSEEELYILCNHKNLQPLFKEENKKKAKPEYKTRNKQKYKANNIR